MMFLQILGSIAEFEHALMSERTIDGGAPAKFAQLSQGQQDAVIDILDSLPRAEAPFTMAHPCMFQRMQKERLTVSLDTSVAARVRQCGARSRGGASGYLERLVRQDEVKEAAAAMGRWYAAQPAAQTDAFLDAIEAELAGLDPAEQQAALLQLGLKR